MEWGYVAVKDHTLGCLSLSNTVVLSLSLVLPPRCRLSVLSSERRLNHSTEASSASPVLPCTTHARSLPPWNPSSLTPSWQASCRRAHMRCSQVSCPDRPADRPTTVHDARENRAASKRAALRLHLCPPSPVHRDRNTTYVCTSVCRDFHGVIFTCGEASRSMGHIWLLLPSVFSEKQPFRGNLTLLT